MSKRDKQTLSMIERREEAIRSKHKADPLTAIQEISELRRENGYGSIMFGYFLRKTAVVSAGLAAWYLYLGQPQDIPGIEDRYPLPAQITVIDSSVPYTTDSGGNKIVQTKDIDFSADSLDITTERYHFIKGQDPEALREIGWVLSAPGKLILWNHNVGLGADAERTRALLAMVEDDGDLPYITVRVNRSSPLVDLERLFTDPTVTARNNLLARSTLGVLDVVKSGVLSKLLRMDYYNPFTQTAVVYSNIESAGAHEMGHGKDFQRFPYDWLYALARPIPPVMLYQEWRASQNAKGIMSGEDGWQFDRYLIPAFALYVLAAWEMSKKISKKLYQNHLRVMEQMRKEQEGSG